MKKLMVPVAIVLLVALLLSLGGLSCAQAPESFHFNYAISSATSPAYATFVGEANAVMEAYPEIQITLVPAGGAAADLALYLNKGVDFAFAGCGDAACVWNGILDFEGKQNQDMRSGWVNFHGNGLSFSVLADSPITSIYELEGEKVATQLGGTAGRLTGLFFDALGIKPDYQPMAISSMVAAVKAKSVVGVAMPGRAPSMLKDIATAVKFRYLPVTEEEVAKANAKYPGQFLSMVMDHTLWPCGEKDWRCLIYSLQTIARPSFPEEVMYKVVKGIYPARDELAKTYGGVWAYGTFPENTIKNVSVPLHPGVIRFFREDLGMTIPNHLIPPEMK